MPSVTRRAARGCWIPPARVVILPKDISAGLAAALSAVARRETVIMPSPSDSSSLPDHRLVIEKRGDGTIVVRVRSEGPEETRLPDAVFSFRIGDPQYAFWLARLAASSTDGG